MASMKRLASVFTCGALLLAGCQPAGVHSIPDDPNAPAGEKAAEQSGTGRFQEAPGSAPPAKANTKTKAAGKNDLGDDGGIKSR